MECVDVRWVGSIQMGLRVIGFVGVDWIPPTENNSAVKSCCEYGNEPYGCIKGMHILDKRNILQPFNKDVALHVCR